jgi:pyruvate kinase
MEGPPATPPTQGRAVGSLRGRLERVRERLLDLERSIDLERYGARRESARNLLHYIAFRRFDLRRDQARLAQLALSSLGRSESHVLYNLDSVIGWLDLRLGRPGVRTTAPPGVDPGRGRAILQNNARALLGPTRRGRSVRIMVTMPSEAADDYPLVRRLIDSGMECARINCAHDGPAEWGRTIANVRRAERSLGRRCLIEMDLAGPKIRTGSIRPGPSVVKLRPARDVLGRVTAPASVWLVAGPGRRPAGGTAPQVPVDPRWLGRRRRRERVELRDARGARRELRLVEWLGGAIRCELRKTTYLTVGTRIIARGHDGSEDTTSVGALEASEGRIRLMIGDRLVLTSRPDPGEGPRRGERGRVLRSAHVACTLPASLGFVRPGESIWLDDGRIGGIVRSANAARLIVEIRHASPRGSWLAGDRGINLPDTDLKLPPLTPKDLDDLRYVARNADVVGFSFVHTPDDLELLRGELKRAGRPTMGVVVKVETRRAFEELPGILLAALTLPRVGVMIARGDLAVEVGFARLAEVQEEILWLCEAAHLPAIWATQVLEGLAKSGLPSRAEVTDAAMGERAECVMLNKGPHVEEAVVALDSILRRMQSHQSKKTAMLRHLRIVERFRTGGSSGRRSPGSRRPLPTGAS